MKRISEFFYSRALAPLWAAILAAVFAYSAYSFRYEFLNWKNLPLVGLYSALCGVCFAAVFLLFFSQKKEKGRPWAFVLSLAFFEAVLWGVLTIVNVGGQFNRKAVGVAFAILLTAFGMLCLLTLLSAAREKNRALNTALAVILCLGFCTAAAGPVLPSKKDIYYKLNYTQNPSFAPLTAEEVNVSSNDRYACNYWIANSIEAAPADSGWEDCGFDFSVGGESFRGNAYKWNLQKSAEYEDNGDRRYTVIGHNDENGLSVRVESVYYEEHAACEWTVYIKNEGTENSPVVSDFYALDSVIPAGGADIYCARGSDNAASDFTLMKIKDPSKNHVFTGTKGRPSDEYMPYFNICGKDVGAVLGIGWTGQWKAQLESGTDETKIRVGQESFDAYLLPGEEVRSPLVSLSFYDGGNPVKGFNTFRNWIMDCVYPENTPYFLNDLDVLYVSHTRTAEEIVNDVGGFDKENLAKTDNFWMDAGWYAGCVNSWSDGVGNWYTSEERFPEGLKQISGLAQENGCGLVVWFEPERLVHGSFLYEKGLENPRWTVDLDPENEENTEIMFNLANDEAREFLAEYIGSTIKDNGISIYRQDFNYEPLKFWEYADENYYGGRTGICENHYVTGLYAYLDALFEMNPGLVMDNCASGGRRLDLEMAKRSIPLWRSDYNCDVHPDTLEANQSQTYNLSLWLPVSGVNIDLSSDYAAISSIFPGNIFTYDSFGSEFFGRYDDVRRAMTKNFYPVQCAGSKNKGVTAMQYGDETGGYMLVYKHEKEKTGVCNVTFSGLLPQGEYRIIYLDKANEGTSYLFSGEELMAGKASISLPEGKAAFVIKYENP